MDLNHVLFLDTESDPITKQPECVQYLYGNTYGIIEDFNIQSYRVIQELWCKAKAVVFFNAPYDMGVLSIMFRKNNYKWVVNQRGTLKTQKTSNWVMNLFGNRYNVRKISFFRNMIQPMLRTFKEQDPIDLHKQRMSKSQYGSTPVIDLLKLWSILVNDSDISLKSLIKKELGKKAIKYTPETAKTEAYRLQDVFCLRELMEKFFIHIKDLEGLDKYTWNDWGYIKTPATFTKIAYKEAYPELNEYKKNNHEWVEHFNIGSGLEQAFHGGITMSFYRGHLDNTGWVDISGAYSKAIQTINTDSYLKYKIIKLDKNHVELKTNVLIKGMVNFLFKTVDKSLKIFKLKKPTLAWIWSDDIKSSYNLYPKFKYTIIEAYEFIPLLDIKQSLPTSWDISKKREKELHGKTTLFQYFKFRSNTGYGITAQRTPFETVHTNMCIAGMITSRVHKVLTDIIRILYELGYKNIYNDTDSSCFYQGKIFTKQDMDNVVDTINKEIYPFTVESEGYNKNTYVLSLKRYISERGDGKDKIRLHGKGRYNIKEQDIYDYVINHKLPDKELKVTQLAANTKIGMGMILKLYPYIAPYKHPFMFEKDIHVDNKTMGSFMYDWYYHIDTKTSFIKDSTTFYRVMHTFRNIHKALRYFRAFKVPRKTEYTNMDYRDWDQEINEDFTIL